MRYRRANVPGGTYFFTVNLAERKRTLLVDHIDSLREVMRDVKKSHPFHIDAMVILPGTWIMCTVEPSEVWIDATSRRLALFQLPPDEIDLDVTHVFG